MKQLLRFAVLLLLACIAITANAQNNGAKPKLFGSLSDKIDCAPSELNKVFSIAANQNVNFSFANNFLFSGTVTSNVVKYANLQTVIIRSSVYDNAIFALSKITNKDGSFDYVGRIINTKYFDGFELNKDNNNNYQLIKIETDKVLQDCNQH